ncbi:hypothetical protein B0H34DRAFT_807447 [Crassisporium funariophilum]|nr:hypothetical protein B0H34DRAFT_807447 [Crassisporium funariophilum]
MEGSLTVPVLPSELEREIFMLAVSMFPRCAVRLILVAGRVREWIEPELYRVLRTDEDAVIPPIYRVDVGYLNREGVHFGYIEGLMIPLVNQAPFFVPSVRPRLPTLMRRLTKYVLTQGWDRVFSESSLKAELAALGSSHDDASGAG